MARCRDCRDYFTIEAALEHSRPGVCVEWSNHQMIETTFTVELVVPSDVTIHEEG